VPMLKPDGAGVAGLLEAPKELGCVDAGVEPNPPPNEVDAGVLFGGMPKLPVAGVVGAGPNENAVAGAGANPVEAGLCVEAPKENWFV